MIVGGRETEFGSKGRASREAVAFAVLLLTDIAVRSDLTLGEIVRLVRSAWRMAKERKEDA